MCYSRSLCSNCPASSTSKEECDEFLNSNIEDFVRVVEKWSSEHPVKTRQSEFLKLFPNVKLDDNGVIEICPKVLDAKCRIYCGICKDCPNCRNEYWLTEMG